MEIRLRRESAIGVEVPFERAVDQIVHEQFARRVFTQIEGVVERTGEQLYCTERIEILFLRRIENFGVLQNLKQSDWKADRTVRSRIAGEPHGIVGMTADSTDCDEPRIGSEVLRGKRYSDHDKRQDKAENDGAKLIHLHSLDEFRPLHTGRYCRAGT